MEVTTTFQAQITPAPQVAHELLVKRADVTCGDLRGSYSYVQAPVCTGTKSICTFSNALQGCCDSAGSCQFYTACKEPLDQTRCSGGQCLSCPTATPNCIKYNFWDGKASKNYDGYSCGALPVGATVIQGLATSIGGTVITTNTTAPSTSTTTPSRTSSLTSSSGTTLTTARSSTGSLGSATATSPASPSPTPVHTTPTSAIAGGVVGGVVGLALIGAGIWWLLRRSRRSTGKSVDHEPQGNWYDNNSRSYEMTQVATRK